MGCWTTKHARHSIEAGHVHVEWIRSSRSDATTTDSDRSSPPRSMKRGRCRSNSSGEGSESRSRRPSRGRARTRRMRGVRSSFRCRLVVGDAGIEGSITLACLLVASLVNFACRSAACSGVDGPRRRSSSVAMTDVGMGDGSMLAGTPGRACESRGKSSWSTTSVPRAQRSPPWRRCFDATVPTRCTPWWWLVPAPETVISASVPPVTVDRW